VSARARWTSLGAIGVGGCLAACVGHARSASGPASSVISNVASGEVAAGGSVDADAVAAELDAIDEPGGVGPWARAAAEILLRAYDHDESGTLDRTVEIRAIECQVWSALDAPFRSGDWTHGIAVIFGFSVDFGWVGGALSMHDQLRPVVADQAARCDVGDPAATGYEPDVDYDARVAADELGA
jgi:hypothetical protein